MTTLNKVLCTRLGLCLMRLNGLAVLATATAIALAGCQLDLHSKVSEADANEMLGALLSAGVQAKKASPDGGKTWNIAVDEGDAVRAIQVLRVNALPRERRATMGELFKKEGLISSPTEERVRFIFGVEQELAETVSRVDGVMVARVHIVLPNNDPLASNVKPSSASVFVKHRQNADMQTLVPAIKNLVVHAVEGLDYGKVTVTLVSANTPEASPVVAVGAAPPTSPRAQDSGAGASGAAAWWPLALGGGLTVLLAAAMAVKRFGRPRQLAAMTAGLSRLGTSARKTEAGG